MKLRAIPLGVLLALLAWPASAAAEDYDAPDPTGLNPPAAPSPGPSISGSAQAGGTLTGSRGTWAPRVTLTSRWLRCDVGASRCDPTGDTDLSYSVTSADIGFTIKLRVVGTRTPLLVGGTRTVDAATATIPAPVPTGLPFPPRNATPPLVQGSPRAGQVLSATTGTWVGTDPISYGFAWASCPKGSPCQPAGTGATYPVKQTDVNRTLLLTVTATNAVASATALARTTVVAGRVKLKRLSPFPVLLIGGRVAGRITRISALRLRRVPGGAIVRVRCNGGGCPYRTKTVKVPRGKSRTVAFKRLQRRMRAGTTVVITVRKGNTLGKYIRLRFRRSSAPARLDRCVAPKSSKPVKCP